MPAIATEARPIQCGLLRLLIISMKPRGRKFVVALYLPRNNYPKPAILSYNVAFSRETGSFSRLAQWAAKLRRRPQTPSDTFGRSP